MLYNSNDLEKQWNNFFCYRTFSILFCESYLRLFCTWWLFNPTSTAIWCRYFSVSSFSFSKIVILLWLLLMNISFWTLLACLIHILMILWISSLLTQLWTLQMTKLTMVILSSILHIKGKTDWQREDNTVHLRLMVCLEKSKLKRRKKFSRKLQTIKVISFIGFRLTILRYLLILNV